MRHVFPALALFAAALAHGAPADVSGFLKTWCSTCHGPSAQMANRRFDTLVLPPSNDDSLILLQEILDQLNLGQMPPAAVKQPPAAQKKAAIEAMTSLVAEAHAKRDSTGGRAVLRRLNRREYRNTISDLLRISLDTFDPTAKFPPDQRAKNMDNLGDVLETSGYQLEQYLEAADQSVERALDMYEPAEQRSWTFNNNFRQQPELSFSHGRVYNFRYLCVYEVQDTINHEGGYGHISEFAEGVHANGFYEIKILAEALNRYHPYDTKIFQMDPEEPFRLAIVPGNSRLGHMHHPQPFEPRLAETVIRDNGPEWYTFRVWLDKGFGPRFTFPNGMMNSRQAFARIFARYRDTLPVDPNSRPGIVEARRAVLAGGKMPHIRIHEVQIKGPFHDVWPPPSRRLLLGGDHFEESKMRALLERFAGRAFRRPPRREEIDRIVTLVEQRRKDGKGAFEAYKDGLKAILVSPAFLYLNERGQTRLDSYALASRLSYFLWSTMPDPALLESASRNELISDKALLAQTRRMLHDPKSNHFINGFLDSWLNLRSLGDMPPDRAEFEIYYVKDFQNAMKQETRLFTRHLLDHNLPVSDYLNADYSFLNKPLAQHYGVPENIPPAEAHIFRKMPLNNPNRGGLLGHGSILTVSANGVETSPVTRGVWILENIFGTPPPPPPDNVPPIDPNVQGTKSIREMLAKHRDNPGCFACHQKIDPPGFALENYDPIGKWRDSYPKGIPIDATGVFPDGASFQDAAGFRKILMERKPLFARNLVDRLLTYACGRRMEALDRPRIDRLMKEWQKRGEGLRDLVELVVTSELFRNR
jgi:hypothetical protein